MHGYPQPREFSVDRRLIDTSRALFLICQEPVGKESSPAGEEGKAEWLRATLLFSVNIDPDLLLPIRNGDVPLRRSNDDRLAR